MSSVFYSFPKWNQGEQAAVEGSEGFTKLSNNACTISQFKDVESTKNLEIIRPNILKRGQGRLSWTVPITVDACLAFG